MSSSHGKPGDEGSRRCEDRRSWTGLGGQPEGAEKLRIDSPGGGAGAATIAVTDAVVSRHRQHDDCRWCVLRIRSRQEKALANSLRASSIDFVLPLVPIVRYYGHRKRRVEVPLFPGYLFLRGSHDDRIAAQETGRVAQVLRVVDQAELERELRSIQLALNGGAALDPFPYLEVGRPVRVRSGPFQGMEGVIDEKRPNDRIILLVRTIGRAVSLEIDASLLEPIDD
ncbi:MAG: transcription termination/antitermination protein NusG [Phycisphaerales bacterium]